MAIQRPFAPAPRLRTSAGYPVLVLAAIMLGGCAVYQHQLVEPPELAGPIDRDGVRFTLEPLDYEAASQHGRLVLRIINHTPDPITLIGERSYLVDPEGETRVLRGGTIAPASYITLALPPDVPAVRSGPRFGVGVGVGTGFRHGRFGVGAHHDPWARHHPAYTIAREPHWRWVTGIVRMRLLYEREEERIEHHLAFDRVKVK